MFFVIPATIFVCAILIAYNVRHDGFLDWRYQWRTRKEAPIYFWGTIIGLVAMAAYFSWFAFEIGSGNYY